MMELGAVGVLASMALRSQVDLHTYPELLLYPPTPASSTESLEVPLGPCTLISA